MQVDDGDSKSLDSGIDRGDVGFIVLRIRECGRRETRHCGWGFKCIVRSNRLIRGRTEKVTSIRVGHLRRPNRKSGTITLTMEPPIGDSLFKQVLYSGSALARPSFAEPQNKFTGNCVNS